ncbi:MAG: hypothetical protein DI603_01675 [Roseateles depolymerans]|uniref:Ice-binding protein C-terminal domain-containing protein n=1 Tax=Roseateles depolymerans TaxID=76731 RepID=A0A2W5E3P8_9BURK|nr:MAG: hypothetical protein DI603_01675 [Roseateles depolymerans]
MRPASHALSAVALAILATPALADSTVYTSAASFLPQLAAGYYTETFDGLADLPPSFSGGGFSYSITTAGGAYATGEYIGGSFPYETLTISFTGASVNAIGADFFANNIGGDFLPLSVSVSLSDGTVVDFTPTSQADSFRGFVSTTSISSVTLGITQPGSLLYPYANLDNLTVGVSAVPEPASAALLGLGASLLWAVRRRKA